MSWEVRYSEIEDIRMRLKNHLDRIRGNLFANTGLNQDEYDEFGFKINRNSKSLLSELEKLKDLILQSKNTLTNNNAEMPQDFNWVQSAAVWLDLSSSNGKRLGGLELIEQGDKIDEDEFAKLQKELEQKWNDAGTWLAEDEHDQKDLFNRKVNQADENEDFKKNMMNELNEKFAKIDGQL